MSETVLERGGDELRIDTPWFNDKRVILLSWWRRKEDGTWEWMEEAGQIGLLGLQELEKVIAALEKAHDWIKETGG